MSKTVSHLLVLAGGLFLAAGSPRRACAQNPPAQPAPAPAVVTGVVMDTVGVPISHAVVSVVGQPLRAITDSAGRFRLQSVQPGLRIFAVRALGYRPLMWSLTLDPGQIAHGRIGLHRIDTAVVLPELTVVGEQYVSPRMAGFYERRRLGLGHYLDREAIERRNAFVTTDLLLGMAGVRVYKTNDPFTNRVVFLRCERIGVYLDGSRLWGDPGENLSLINPADVEAMEIYRGASELPAEFMSDDCAAIVIWTRY
jgi:hypothetical protein